MNGIIHVPADRVWAYFKRYEGELRSSLHLIAEWEECGIEIYLTAESDFPCIQVFADDTFVEETISASADECEEDADEIYDTYLTQNLFGRMEEFEVSGDHGIADEDEDKSEEREAELDVALAEFLEIALKNGELPDNESAIDPDDELFQEIKESFLEYLACEIGYRVYRPTICNGVDGKQYVVDFPYQAAQDDLESKT